VVGFVWSFGKSLVLPRYYNWDVVKTRQASHGLTETHQKGHWKIMLQGGERDEHTLFEITGLVQMAKSDPVAQAKSSLSNCTWLERWVWVLILNHLETSNASREQGRFIYYFFFLSLSLYIHIFSSPFSFFHTFFFFSIFYFFILPLNSRLHCTYLLGNSPHAYTVARPRAKRWKFFYVPR
jgi:hypothetical protein